MCRNVPCGQDGVVAPSAGMSEDGRTVMRDERDIDVVPSIVQVYIAQRDAAGLAAFVDELETHYRSEWYSDDKVLTALQDAIAVFGWSALGPRVVALVKSRAEAGNGVSNSAVKFLMSTLTRGSVNDAAVVLGVLDHATFSEKVAVAAALFTASVPGTAATLAFWKRAVAQHLAPSTPDASPLVRAHPSQQS